MRSEVEAAAVTAGRVTGAPRRARSDAALVRAAQRGSQEAVGALFDRYWDDAHRAAYWIVHDAAAAEDIAQEAFLSALRSLDRFDRRRPFGPWLHRIVVNRAIDHARARAARSEVSDEALASHSAADVAPPDRELLAAVAALPVDQRAVVVLRYLLGDTPGEIAAALDLPRGTVNSRLRRGLDALREQVDQGARPPDPPARARHPGRGAGAS